MKRLATAQVVSIVDGDTLHSMLDIGWGIILRPRGLHGGAGTIRVLFPDGAPYDAPETKTPKGKLARDMARSFAVAGQSLEVLSHGLDDFGRTLGSVTLPDGKDWATLMTELGFVKPR